MPWGGACTLAPFRERGSGGRDDLADAVEEKTGAVSAPRDYSETEIPS